MSDTSDDDEAAMLARMSAAHARRKRPCGSADGAPTLSQPPEPRAAAPQSRPTLWAAHESTSVGTSGLGAKLAGTAPSTEPLADATALCSRPRWVACAADRLPPLPPPVAAHVAVRLEVRRSALIRRLQARFAEMCAAHGSGTPPMNALERWRFLSKWDEEVATGAPPGDPIFPVAPYGDCDDAEPIADDNDDAARVGVRRSAGRWLLSDLLRAGLSPAAARDLVHDLGAASEKYAEEMRRASQQRRDEGVVAEAAHGEMIELRASVAGESEDMRVSLTRASYAKLRALYDDSSSDSSSGDDEFRCRLFALLLRYQGIGGAGLHAALGPPVFDALRRALPSLDFECAASPLNSYHRSYCSAYADVDAPFGSRGSFALFRPMRGAYEVNPPFAAGLIDAIAAHILDCLSHAESRAEPLAFVVVLPGWRDSAGWRALDASAHRVRALHVAAADHGYVDGAQHTRPRTYRQSAWDTSLFFMQAREIGPRSA